MKKACESEASLQIPTPQTHIEGTYAYNEFQFIKREAYIYEIFSMQKYTKKWLKESVILPTSSLYMNLHALSHVPKRTIKKQTVPALLSMRKVFLQVAEGKNKLSSGLVRLAHNTDVHIQYMERKINEQESSWITAIKKRMLPVPDVSQRQLPIIGDIAVDERENIPPVSLDMNGGWSEKREEKPQNSEVKNIVSRVQEKVKNIFQGVKNIFSRKKEEKISLRNQFFPQIQ